MIAPENLPTDASGFLHLYNQTSGSLWELKGSDDHFGFANDHRN